MSKEQARIEKCIQEYTGERFETFERLKYKDIVYKGRDGVLRVFGKLNLSRTIGDRKYKTNGYISSILTAEPEIAKVMLKPGMNIIIGSDGFWEHNSKISDKRNTIVADQIEKLLQIMAKHTQVTSDKEIMSLLKAQRFSVDSEDEDLESKEEEEICSNAPNNFKYFSKALVYQTLYNTRDNVSACIGRFNGIKCKK